MAPPPSSNGRPVQQPRGVVFQHEERRKLEGNRKQSATRADKAKKPKVTARPSGSTVAVVATPRRWRSPLPASTVPRRAALEHYSCTGCGDRSRAALLALPAAAGANGLAAPAAASIVAAASAPPASRFDNGVTVPLALSRAAGGRDVPRPIRVVGYEVELVTGRSL